jgi:mannose-6-phosphate isomerase-like protein (cupin superfamily)
MGGMDIVNLADSTPFTTKDGSEIRELLAHRNSAIRNQSLAEARLPAGAATAAHFHPAAEEIYFLLEGRGRMQIEAEIRTVAAGDAIAIPPGARHQIANIGDSTLRFLCCCAPGYEHEDTVMVDDWPGRPPARPT